METVKADEQTSLR